MAVGLLFMAFAGVLLVLGTGQIARALSGWGAGQLPSALGGLGAGAMLVIAARALDRPRRWSVLLAGLGVGVLAAVSIVAAVPIVIAGGFGVAFGAGLLALPLICAALVYLAREDLRPHK